MQKKKLLVADDSLTIQKVIRLALASEGFHIQAVSDGQDAIQQIAVFRPDSVLIDVSLPKKDAFEVKQEFEQDPQAPKFILMYSAFEELDERKISEHNFHGRLIKPFDPAHLRDVLVGVEDLEQSSPPKIETQPVPDESPNELPSEETFQYSPTDPSSDIEIDDHEFRPLNDFQHKAPPKPQPEVSLSEKMAAETFEMSGLGDFEWGIQEKNKMPGSTSSTSNLESDLPGKLPAAHPPNPSLISDEEITSIENFSPKLKPPEKMMDTEGVEFEFEAIKDEPSGILPRPPGFVADSENTKQIAAQLDPKRVEELVRQEIRGTLEKVTRQLLPDIAEKVI